MADKTIYLCENSLEGILTAVYNAFADQNEHENNKIQISEGMYHQELFATYVSVETDFEKAVKVARTLQNKVSATVYELIQKTAVSYNMDKADAIYRVIILALKMGNRVIDYLTEPNVQFLMELERNMQNELQRELQFLRFEELASGVLFAKINPKNALLPYLAEHFSDRFSGEDWVIADTVHRGVLIHEKNKGCSLANMEDVDFDALILQYSEGEELWQKLWKKFVDAIAIKERINPELQRQMLPLRFRKYMRELQK